LEKGKTFGMGSRKKKTRDDPFEKRRPLRGRGTSVLQEGGGKVLEDEEYLGLRKTGRQYLVRMRRENRTSTFRRSKSRKSRCFKHHRKKKKINVLTEK